MHVRFDVEWCGRMVGVWLMWDTWYISESIHSHSTAKKHGEHVTIQHNKGAKQCETRMCLDVTNNIRANIGDQRNKEWPREKWKERRRAGGLGQRGRSGDLDARKRNNSIDSWKRERSS